MLLHFIFVIEEKDLENRKQEFEYIKQMAKFYQVWIKENFSKYFQVRCDEMITKPQSMLERLDTHVLVKDHNQRGKNIFHFYLTHFRPLWTDCTCEGYTAENFGMVLWRKPENQYDTLFLAEKNCTTVSHELSHELLRQEGKKKHKDIVHEVWTDHLFRDIPFNQYDSYFKKTEDKPMFLTLDPSRLKLY